jgi:sialate O-acetylesterase
MKALNFCLFLAFFFAQAAKADVRLPAVIGSNMVLQQKATVKLWGWGSPGEKVLITTSWNNKVDSAKTDENAKWQVPVQTPAAGGPFTITIKGSNTIVLQNVLVGEVWVCSGQSNMEMNYYWGLAQMREDIPSAANPNIRLFTVPKSTAETPQEKGEGSWAMCDSNTVKSFSAVAYYFGRKLNAGLNVPIGLVHASWSGTPAEVWTPAEEVSSRPDLKAAAQKLTRSNGWPITTGYSYNAMIAPLVNYAIAGAIWYQGESNTGTASTYQQLFTTMITAWRKNWKEDFPFYYVQLAPFAYGNKAIGALLREAQTKTLALSKTGMVVTADIGGDTADIHPKNKREVGYRLANLALADTYGQTIDGAKSPLFKEMHVSKNEAVLLFDNAEKGLQQKGKDLAGFFIAGSDKIFYPAQVKIKGNTLVVSSKEVKEPVAVRYAFSNTAVGNVFSKAGLPECFCSSCKFRSWLFIIQNQQYRGRCAKRYRPGAVRPCGRCRQWPGTYKFGCPFCFFI